MATSRTEKATTALAVGDSPRPFFFPRESASKRDRERVVFDSKSNSTSAQQTPPFQEHQLDASTAEDENLTVVCVDGEWIPEIELFRRGYEAVHTANRDEIDSAVDKVLRCDLKRSVRHIRSHSVSEGLREKAIRIMERPARRTWRW